MFTQILDPTGNLFLTWLVALVPVVLLLFLLAGLRLSAWLAVLIGSIVTFLLGLWVWKMPLDDGIRAYLYGSATGIWNHLLGRDAVQHADDHRRVRQIAPLAHSARHP
jgi:lactate permease